MEFFLDGTKIEINEQIIILWSKSITEEKTNFWHSGARVYVVIYNFYKPPQGISCICESPALCKHSPYSEDLLTAPSGFYPSHWRGFHVKSLCLRRFGFFFLLPPFTKGCTSMFSKKIKHFALEMWHPPSLHFLNSPPTMSYMLYKNEKMLLGLIFSCDEKKLIFSNYKCIEKREVHSFVNKFWS
jgi:hypothetical protein